MGFTSSHPACAQRLVGRRARCHTTAAVPGCSALLPAAWEEVAEAGFGLQQHLTPGSFTLPRPPAAWEQVAEASWTQGAALEQQLALSNEQLKVGSSSASSNH